MKIIFYLIIMGFLLLNGCTSIPNNIEFIQPEQKVKLFAFIESPRLPCNLYGQYIIAADERGNHIPLIFETTVDENEKCKVSVKETTSDDDRKNNTEKHIKNILDGIKASGKKPLIFIHGGLNNYQESIDRVNRDIDKINAEGEYYPFFFIWPSGLDTFPDSLSNYFQGEWDRPADKVDVPFKIITDLMQVPSRLLANYATHIRLASNSACYLETDAPFYNEVFCTINSWLAMIMTASKKNALIMNNSYITNDPCMKGKEKKDGFHCAEITKTHIEEFLYRKYYLDGNLFKRMLLPPKLLTIPIVDPLAKRGWNSMIARIRFTFRTPCPTYKFSKGNCEPGVAYKFFNALKHRIDIGEIDKKITLIGHSMGSIVTAEIIREFNDLPYENVIFGGAAISIREFKNTVEATLLRKVAIYKRYSELINSHESLKGKLQELKKTPEIDNVIKGIDQTIIELKRLEERHEPFKFYNLSLHPFAEAWEENWGGLVPSGSLLEWIDQIIENPADGLDRTLGKWANISPLLAAQADPDDEYFDHNLLKNCYMHFSRFGLNPKQPFEHSHFGNDENGRFKYWEPKNWKLDDEQC